MKALASLTPLVLLAGCGGTPADQAAAPEPVALVKTAPAEQGAASDQLTVYGAAEAGPGSERAMVAPAEAVLGTILAPTGTTVRAGQPIAILRASPTTRLNAMKASSDLQAARLALGRAERLRADGLASNADVEAARAGLQSASATGATLGIGAGGLTLRAPASGTVQALTARTGDTIPAGTTVATIAAGGDLRARFGVDPALAPRIRAGQPIAVTPIGGGAPVQGVVAGVDPQVDATTRLASIYVRIPAASGIGAGAPLRATISVSASANGITVPYAALLDDGGQSFVFVVRGGVAKQIHVSPGNSAGDRIQILRGLQSGDRVVTEGGTALEDGMKVREGSAGK